MKNATKFTDYQIERLREWSASATEAKTRLMEKIGEDPVHAMSWSAGYFKTFALGQVADRILSVIDDPETDATVETLTAYTQEQAISRAMHPEQSTSATSNFMALMVSAAWARAADLLTKGY